MNLNFSYDSLTLYDGDSDAAPMLGQGKYCGVVHSQIITSSSNEILVNFQSDKGGPSYGFKLQYLPHSK